MKLANLAIARAMQSVRTARALVEMAAHLVDWERGRRERRASDAWDRKRMGRGDAGPAALHAVRESLPPRSLPAAEPAPFDVPLEPARVSPPQAPPRDTGREALGDSFSDTMSSSHNAIAIRQDGRGARDGRIRHEPGIDSAIAAAIDEHLAREAAERDEAEARVTR